LNPKKASFFLALGISYIFHFGFYLIAQWNIIEVKVDLLRRRGLKIDDLDYTDILETAVFQFSSSGFEIPSF
jgi:hypothetical protein